MKCKKFDDKWFDNKAKQIMNRTDSPEKRAQRTKSLINLAIEKGFKIKNLKELV